MSFRAILLYSLILTSSMAYGQNAKPMQQAHPTFVDGSGSPCSGCQLYSYAAGTTTPQATYTDSSGTTQNTNPIILDAAGGANVWMGGSAYKFVLKDSLGTMIWTADNVSSFLSTTGGTINGNISVNGAISSKGETVNGDLTVTGNLNFSGSIAPSTINGTAVVQNPSTQQTINQPAGTNFNINTSGGGKQTLNGIDIYNLYTSNSAVISAGDSITACVGASSTATCWPYLVTAKMGASLTDIAVSGAISPQWDDQIFGNLNPQDFSNPTLITMIGTNDSHNDATGNFTGNWKPMYSAFLSAGLSWAAIPQSSKTFATGCSQSGTWSSDNTYQTGIGLQSTTNGSTLTCSLTTFGGPIYGWYRMADYITGAFTYSVDAGTAISVSTQITNTNTGLKGVGFIRVPVSAGTHTVVFSVTSATGGANNVPILGIGTMAMNTPFYQGPTVYSAGVPYRENDAEGTYTSAYNAIAQTNISQLNSDGLHVYSVDTRKPGYWGTNPSQFYQVDGAGVHPNDLGETKIEAAFEAVLRPVGTQIPQHLNVQGTTPQIIVNDNTHNSILTQNDLGLPNIGRVCWSGLAAASSGIGLSNEDTCITRQSRTFFNFGDGSGNQFGTLNFLDSNLNNPGGVRSVTLATPGNGQINGTYIINGTGTGSGAQIQVTVSAGVCGTPVVIGIGSAYTTAPVFTMPTTTGTPCTFTSFPTIAQQLINSSTANSIMTADHYSLPNIGVLTWSSTPNASNGFDVANVDTGLSRTGPHAVSCGNGAPNDASCSFSAGSIQTGTTSTGTCTSTPNYVTLTINGNTYKLATCP